MINLFCQSQKYSYEYMISHNGDVTIKHPIEAYVNMARNEIWYLTITFPRSDLLGFEIENEAIFKVDLNFERDQLFRTIYKKYNKGDDTYTVYANHIFFDAQKEVFIFDNRTVKATWDGAIENLNRIVQASGSNHPYRIYGRNWYNNFENVAPEDGIIVYFRNVQNPSYALDVPNASETSGTQLQTYVRNQSAAQSFMLKKVGEYKGAGVYGILSLCSCRWVKSSGGKVVLGSVNTEPASNDEKWIIIKTNNGYELAPYSYIYYGMYPSSTNIANGNAVIVYDRGTGTTGSACRWYLESADSTATAYWERYNIIQCMFGTEDNSLMNRWNECELHRYTAMLDNYSCYFGRPKNYPFNLQPSDIRVDNKQLTNYAKKISMEKVVTGLIPKAYNGRILPNNEIVKSEMWNNYSLHRIEVKEYSNIKLLEDDTEASKNTLGVFQNLSTLQSYLRIVSQKDLKYSERLQYPTSETTCTIEDLFGNDNVYSETIKLNDIIHASVGNNQTEIFYIDELKYDLISLKVTDMKLVLDTEV